MSPEPQSQYELASFGSAQRRQAAAKALALLKAVPRSESARFEVFDYDSDNSSDVPDPFSEDECDQLEFALRRKVCFSLPHQNVCFTIFFLISGSAKLKPIYC